MQRLSSLLGPCESEFGPCCGDKVETKYFSSMKRSYIEGQDVHYYVGNINRVGKESGLIVKII